MHSQNLSIGVFAGVVSGAVLGSLMGSMDGLLLFVGMRVPRAGRLLGGVETGETAPRSPPGVALSRRRGPESS